MAAEVRCPMCGKNNPADRETCQFCQARLKPIVAGGKGQSDAPAARKPRGEESPDWLRDLRGNAGDQATAGKPDAGDQLPDWLRGGGEDASKGSLPSWLTDLRDDKAAPAKPGAAEDAAQGGPEGGLYDWMSGDDEARDDTPAFDSRAFALDEGDDEIPDWLTGGSNPAATGFGSERREETGAAAEWHSPSAASDTPDWMGGFRMSDTEAEPEFGSDDEPATAEDIPDWLKSFGDAPAASEPPAMSTPARMPPAPVSEEPEPGELPDWLNQFSAAGTPPAVSQPQQTFIPDEPEAQAEPGDLPDWLNQFSSAGTTPAPSQPQQTFTPDEPEAQAEPGDLPDWLNQFNTAGTSPATPAPAAAPPEPQTGDMPDWLSQFAPSGAPGHPAAPEETEPEPEPDDLPDWLGQFNTAEPAPTSLEPTASQPGPQAEPGELPDWLSSMGAGVAGATAADKSQPAAEPGEIPDWLSSMGAAPAPAELSVPEPADKPADKPADVPGAEPDELPDWMGSFGQADTLEVAAEPTAQEGDLPDWLSQMNEAPPAPAGDQPAAKKPFDTGSLNDWFSQPEGGAGDLPEWMAGFSQGTPTSSSTGELKGKASETLPPAGEQEPEWMRAIQGTPSAPKIGASQEDDEWHSEVPGEEEGEGGDLSWLQSLEAATPDLGSAPMTGAPAFSPVNPFDEAPVPAGAEEPLFDTEMPDWLSQMRPETQAIQGDEGELSAAAEGSLTPAELPSWLEAMRPMGSGEGGEQEIEGETESAGPLSGLRGVLPAEPGIAEVTKPQPVSFKLQVNEAQQHLAQMLEQMVKAEGEVQALPSRQVINAQNVLRIAVALVLLLAVVWPLLPGVPQITVNPVVEPLPAGGAIYDLIGSLPAQAPVLLAVDYEPGLSGEMNSLVTPVVAHLLRQGVNLSLVSTTPNGPAMAENMLAIAQQRAGTAALYTNLGFIPGGPTGLLSLAENPLVDGTHLQDYRMVLVATQDPDDGRAWIEQVGLHLQDTPLVMLVSAQAEPLIAPYARYGGEQVTQLLAGVAGGRDYDTRLNGGASSDGLATGYWTPLSIGLMAAVFMIVIGGLTNLISVGLTRRREKGQAPAGGVASTPADAPAAPETQADTPAEAPRGKKKNAKRGG